MKHIQILLGSNVNRVHITNLQLQPVNLENIEIDSCAPVMVQALVDELKFLRSTNLELQMQLASGNDFLYIDEFQKSDLEQNRYRQRFPHEIS